MKFILSTTGDIYTNKKQIKVLEDLGFTFTPCENFTWFEYRISGEPEIEFNTLEDLIEFSKHHTLILDKGLIEIYDDYRE